MPPSSTARSEAVGHLGIPSRSLDRGGWLGPGTGTTLCADHQRGAAMNLNADFSARAAVHAARIPWVPSPMRGVERRMLGRIGEGLRGPLRSCATRRKATLLRPPARRRRGVLGARRKLRRGWRTLRAAVLAAAGDGECLRGAHRSGRMQGIDQGRTSSLRAEPERPTSSPLTTDTGHRVECLHP